MSKLNSSSIRKKPQKECGQKEASSKHFLCLHGIHGIWTIHREASQQMASTPVVSPKEGRSGQVPKMESWGKRGERISQQKGREQFQ